MQDTLRFKKLVRLSSYVTLINLEEVYQIDYSQSKTSVLIHLFKGNDNILNRDMVDFYKMEDDVFLKNIDDILNELGRYRIR